MISYSKLMEFLIQKKKTGYKNGLYSPFFVLMEMPHTKAFEHLNGKTRTVCPHLKIICLQSCPHIQEFVLMYHLS